MIQKLFWKNKKVKNFYLDFFKTQLISSGILLSLFGLIIAVKFSPVIGAIITVLGLCLGIYGIKSTYKFSRNIFKLSDRYYNVSEADKKHVRVTLLKASIPLLIIVSIVGYFSGIMDYDKPWILRFGPMLLVGIIGALILRIKLKIPQLLNKK